MCYASNLRDSTILNFISFGGGYGYLQYFHSYCDEARFCKFWVHGFRLVTIGTMVSCWEVKKVKCQSGIANFLSKKSFYASWNYYLHRHSPWWPKLLPPLPPTALELIQSNYSFQQQHSPQHPSLLAQQTPPPSPISSPKLFSLTEAVTACTKQPLPTLAVPLYMSPVKSTAGLPYLIQFFWVNSAQVLVLRSISWHDWYVGLVYSVHTYHFRMYVLHGTGT